MSGSALSRSRPIAPGYPLMNDKTMMRETKARLAETGLGIHDIEFVRFAPETDVEVVKFGVFAFGVRRSNGVYRSSTYLRIITLTWRRDSIFHATNWKNFVWETSFMIGPPQVSFSTSTRTSSRIASTLKSWNAEAITAALEPSMRPYASPPKVRCTGDHWPRVMNRTKVLVPGT